jgi:competence protein ComEC
MSLSAGLPMRSRMIAASLGIALVALLPALPALSLWLCLPALSLLVLGSWHWRGPGALLCALCGGLLWALLSSQLRLHTLLPEALEARDFWVTGRVTGLPQRSERAQQVHFQVEHSCFDLLPADCPSQVALFRERLVLLNYYGAHTLEPGQRWFWRVRLNRPRGFANPGGFDYEAWLVQQGVAARGYVRDTAFNARLADGGAWLSRLRHGLRERLLQGLEGRSQSGIILALVLGDRELVSSDDWELFTQTGTNHLIVISGLHVGFIAWLCGLLAAWGVRLLPSALLRLPAQQWGNLAAILGAVAYGLLAGFSVPTQRACVMVLVFAGAQLAAWRLPHSFSFCLALLLVLLINPLSVTGAGFWLSFGAVGTLLLAFGGWRRLHRRAASLPAAQRHRRRVDWPALWLRWGQPQWVMFIGMLVPLGLWMQQFSVLAPLANVLAIPLVSLLVVPLCLLGAALLLPWPAAGSWLLHRADALLVLLGAALQQVTELPVPALWDVAGVTLLEGLLALAGSLLLLLPRGWPRRWLGAVMLLPMLLPGEPDLPPGQAQVSVLDVGQGLAVVVRTARHTLLYDAGPRFSERFDAGAGIVLPFLRHAGVRRLDRVIISHGDNDHAGGLLALLEGIAIAGLWTGEVPGEVERAALTAARVPAARCQRGQSWQWDDVHFAVLWPPVGEPAAGNDSSCVLRIEAGGRSVLLTGDIERRAEAALLRADVDALRSDWLLVPHHGSQTSSSMGFLAAVDPCCALYSAGYRNQFRHPAPLVAARYHERGVTVWNTALRGALQLCLGAQEGCDGPPRAWRESRRHWWQAPVSQASRELHGERPATPQAL